MRHNEVTHLRPDVQFNQPPNLFPLKSNSLQNDSLPPRSKDKMEQSVTPRDPSSSQEKSV